MLQVVPVAGAMNLRNVTRYHPGVNVTAELAPARDKSGNQGESLLSFRSHLPLSSSGKAYGCLCLAPVLHVRLHGGYYVYGPQRADFQFLCDPSVDEVRLQCPYLAKIARSSPDSLPIRSAAIEPLVLLDMERHAHLPMAHEARLRLPPGRARPQQGRARLG